MLELVGVGVGLGLGVWPVGFASVFWLEVVLGDFGRVRVRLRVFVVVFVVVLLVVLGVLGGDRMDSA